MNKKKKVTAIQRLSFIIQWNENIMGSLRIQELFKKLAKKKKGGKLLSKFKIQMME